MSLEEAKLQKRSSELDAREQFIDAKLAELEKAPLTFKVYEARIKAFENRLATLQEDNRQAVVTSAQIKHDGDVLIEKQELRVSKMQQKLLEAENKVNELDKSVTVAEGTLTSLNKEIRQREQYQKTQEEQIAQAISDGNDHLLDLKDTIASIEIDIKHARSTLIELGQEITDLTNQKTILEEQSATMSRELNTTKKKLLLEIQGLEEQLIELSRKKRTIDEDIDKKMRLLEEKEASVVAKRDALVLEKQELQQEKRRFNSTKSAYTV